MIPIARALAAAKQGSADMTEAPTQTRHGGCKVRARERATRSQTAVGHPCIGSNLPAYYRLGEDGLVRIEGAPLSESLRSAPNEFTSYALNPPCDIQIFGRQLKDIQNFQNFIKYIDSRPRSQPSGSPIGEPTDMPVSKRHPDVVYPRIRYPERPFMRSVTAGKRSEDSIDMSRILFGDGFIDLDCAIPGIVNVCSPPVRGGAMTKRLRTYPGRGHVETKKVGMSDAWY